MLRVDEMVKKVTTLKASMNLGQLLEEVYYRGDQYVIERAGKPMAAIVPVWHLEEWLKRRERPFGMVDEVRQRRQDGIPEVLEEDIQDAIHTIQAENQRPT
jgi:prevent-host-death family protein